MKKQFLLCLFFLAFAIRFQAQVVVNEIHADPASGSAGDANGDGLRDSSQDEFVEILNAGSSSINISGWRIRDNAVSNRHTFSSGTIVPAGGSIVVFGGGNPQGNFGNSLVQTATSGALGFNNAGDRVTLLDGSGSTVDFYDYVQSEGGDNQSITRSPDGIGTFQKHLTVSALRYSPGTTINGSSFSSGCEATISNFPHSESFEIGFGSWVQSSNDDLDLTRRSGSTPSSGTGPTSANDGSVYVYVEASGNGTGYPGKIASLISPCFDLSSLTNPTFNFDYHMLGTDVNNLRVEVSTNGGSSWVQVFSRSGSQGSSWMTASLNLSAYQSSQTQLRFTITTGTSSSGWSSDIAIDNISLQGASGGGASCLSTISNFPYVESFESNLGSWSQSTSDNLDFTRTSGSTPSSGTGPSTASSGSVYVYVEASGNGTGYPNKVARIATPCFDLRSLSTPQISFDYHMYGSDINNLRAEVSTNAGSTWTQIFARSGNQGNNWFSQSIDVSAYRTASTQFRFTVTTGTSGSGWSSDIALDNVRVGNGSTGGGGSGDAPLHVVTWNIEWFGSTSNGPSPESTQKERVKGIIQTLDADVYALQEIANESLMTELVNELPEYSWVFSTYVSGGTNTPGSSQKLAFIYKPSRINLISSEALLTNLHPTYNGGNTSFVSDFPTGSPSQFWASGRMPYMLTADVNVGGVTERVYFIDIHAKASGGSTNIARRRYDAEKLKGYMDTNLGNQNIVFLGDYNDQMDFADSPYNLFFNDNVNNPGADGEYFDVLTRQMDINGVNTFVTSSSFLDHITISNELIDNYSAESITVHDEVVTSDFTDFISDHIPVSAKFRFGSSSATRVGNNNTGRSDIREIELQTIKFDWNIYPNPANGVINIDLLGDNKEQVSLIIFDAQGRVIIEKNLEMGSTQLQSKDLGEPGLYIFQIQNSEGTSYRRMITR